MDSALPKYILADEARLRQILFNLVGNAVKFTQAGRVQIRARPGENCTSESQQTLVLEVEDTGIGMPEGCLEAVFEPFARLEDAYTRSYQGAGIGLTIVKRLVEGMGGCIDVHSIEHLGTSVRVVLPLLTPSHLQVELHEADAEAQTAAHDRVLHDGSAGPTSAAAYLPTRLRILLAEDDRMNQVLMTRLLEKEGHHVTVASDGLQVVEMLSRGEFHCILMDIQMPHMNGVEATRTIRSSVELGRKRAIPIIAVTAHTMAGDRELFLGSGMNDYVPKPVLMPDLRAALERTGVLSGESYS